jgi:hypothetical protein
MAVGDGLVGYTIRRSMIIVLGWIFLVLIILSMLFGTRVNSEEEERQRRVVKEHDDRMYELERERLQLERDRLEWEHRCYDRENPEPIRPSTPGVYIHRRRLL